MPSLDEDIDYIRAAIRDWHARTNHLHPCVPADMRSDPNPDEEWQSWRAIDSTITLASVASFERQLPASLPQFFRAYMLGCHALGMDFGEYRLPDSPSDKTIEQSFSVLRDSTFWAAGYMQIGTARGCGDPLLFDFQSPTDDGDYAIVVFNHDVVPREIRDDRSALKPYESLLAPSFRAFFDLVLGYDDSIFPAPLSAEETRRNDAWDEVTRILEEKGYPRYFRPKGIPADDPWQIAKAIRDLPDIPKFQ
ncbi:SMI1/KNR4 family protein [Stieleria varia]|uniref:Knr4/Smi1-like domain-containing protein n=1 Tax=Stieleria varia TaxID=2528005 RepID=A0A5C6ASD9_9BACT|nr:SMI1/KNR4 family protein [Stieleria varia]TWU01094.1 hypothetical protein Pla52n_44660 [Stieleria varia]